jgi:hypothetical protein
LIVGGYFWKKLVKMVRWKVVELVKMIVDDWRLVLDC